MAVSIDQLDLRLRMVERLVNNPAHMDTLIRHWRATADMSVIGVLEGETCTTIGDMTLEQDMTVYGTWLIIDAPGGASNAAGKSGIIPLEV